MKKTLLIFLLFVGIGSTYSQIVNIPDANFKAYLVGNTLINTNMDTEIQVSEASAFSGLINCSNLNISDLTGISAFTSLTSLYCNDNLLTSLNISSNSALTALHCYNNSIGNIDFSNNTSLTDLRCFSNQLTSLDVSGNPALTFLSCTQNLFSSINVKNGNNTAITQFFAGGNPNLTCIQVDDAVYSTTNWTNIDAAASFSENCAEFCTVNIPDANFKAYLVGNTAINTNGDTEIQCTEAAAFTGEIGCNNSGISDLTGIEAFTGITQLICSSNPLSSLDVSSNTALTFLSCPNTALTSLDVSNNTALTQLYCNNNSLSSLDVSSNTALINLSCNNNSLGSLNVSSNTALTNLTCYNNSLTSLDVSSNTALTNLRCYDNSLTSLNVANGNNTNFTTFNATNNPNLTCIQVDDSAYSTTNWTGIDAGASFSENCGGTSSLEEYNAHSLNIYPNPASSTLTIETEATIESIQITNVNGMLVQNETTKSFSVESLTNGVYIIHVKTNEGAITKRFIKE